jgi:uncharacterized protein HemX
MQTGSRDVEATTMATATADRQRYALQTIFSFFLGLMVLAFIGVGVNTFYQSPEDRVTPQRDDIQRQMDQLNVKSEGRSLDATDQAKMDKLQAAQNELGRSIETAMKDWARTTSIILILFATLVMGVSLIRSEQLRVVSNGLLLGGLFTMLYGTGWVIFSGNSTMRFVAITFALLVALGLGYLKFVRERAGRAAAEATAGAVGAAAGATGATAGAQLEPGAVGDLEARVAALEARAAAAAAALGGEQEAR